MRWGLIPHWARDVSIASSTIRAKSETAAEQPAVSDALKYRRCLIPTDGFYEWKRHGTAKQPYCSEVNEGELFGFAGLWDGWKNAAGQPVTQKFCPSKATPQGPTGIAFDGANIWTASSNSNNVSKVRASDGAVLGTFAVGTRPLSDAVDQVFVSRIRAERVNQGIGLEVYQPVAGTGQFGMPFATTLGTWFVTASCLGAFLRCMPGMA